MSNSGSARYGTGIALWMRWVVATAIGMVIAFTAFVAIFSVIGEPSDSLFPVLMAGVGLIVGVFQQRVLRRWLGEVRWWAIATGIGLGVGIALALALALGEGTGLRAQILEGTAAGAAVGSILGILQWLALRTRLQGARWWVPASIGGWAAGAAAGNGVAYFVDEGLDILVAPVVAATITGLALVELTRSRRSARSDEAMRPPRIQNALADDVDRIS